MRSRWWTVAALLAALACLIAAFLVFPQTVVERLPRWAQRHIALSVDRHGGMRYLLEVDASDVKKQRIDALRDDARGVLREARIASTNAIRGDGVEIRIREGTDVPQALNRLRELAQPLGGPSGGAGKPSVDV